MKEVRDHDVEPSTRTSSFLRRRRLLKAVGGVGLVAIAAALLVACGSSRSSTGSAGSGGSDSAKPVTFGFSHPYAEFPVVASVKSLVQGYGERAGWKVLLDETRAGKLVDQQATLDTWITQGITAINVFPTEPSAFEATAQRAVKEGIIWTTYANRMKTGAGGVLFPNELSGKVTGQATVDWINAHDPNAEVLILESPLTGGPRKKTDVPKGMIEQQTNAKIVSVQVSLEQSNALQVTEDVLQAHPNVSVVVAYADDSALGAAEAFRKAGKLPPSKVFIIGQDGSKEALAALRAGDTYFRASAALDLAKLAEETVGVTERAIKRHWKPGDKQEYVTLAPTLIEVGDTSKINRFLSTFQ